MKPIVKYQGGKTKELPLLSLLLPAGYLRLIEPFCGGAALSFNIQHPNTYLTDTNSNVINLYKVVASAQYSELQEAINKIKLYTHNELEALYYSSRNIINKPTKYTDYERAFAFIIVRQLTFSGMERYNSKGEFNVPFGHYKSFSCNLSLQHHNFLSTCEIKCENAINVIEKATENDFIFLDPPYIDRLGYHNGDGGLSLHEALCRVMKSTKAKWLFVHSDCEFYRDNLKDYNFLEKDFLYAQRFGKGKNHDNAIVKHIYVRNYE